MLVRILTEPRNALVRQYQLLFRHEDVALEFSDGALHEVARQAMAQGNGARGLRSVLEAVLLRTMYELPSHPDVVSCRVDEDAVTGAARIPERGRSGESVRVIRRGFRTWECGVMPAVVNGISFCKLADPAARFLLAPA
jgi:ATP-dependent Clp protease ATP-binding subunit ClpX